MHSYESVARRPRWATFKRRFARLPGSQPDLLLTCHPDKPHHLMPNQFFEQPTLNAAAAFPRRPWELDADSRPDHKVVMHSRRCGKR